jgi:hypothetical protein
MRATDLSTIKLSPAYACSVTIGTKVFYVEGQLVIRHGRHFSVVLFFSKGPDDERLKVLKEVAKIFLPRVPKV